jgi:hypothetical protein
MQDMLIYASAFSTANYDKLLAGWASQPVKNNVKLGAQSKKYCNSDAARSTLVNQYNWIITDGGDNCTSTVSIFYNTTVFNEAGVDDGSIGNDINLTLTNDQFVNATFVQGTHYAASNVPGGLNLSVTRNSNTDLILTLTGNATVHDEADDISNIALTFLDAAFVSGNSSVVENKTKSNISVDYIENNPPTNIILSNSSIAENVTAPGQVGDLSTIDPDSGDTHTYTINCASNGAGRYRFYNQRWQST